MKCSCPDKYLCIDSRPAMEHRTRRYKCTGCGSRWTTIEVIVGDLNPGQTLSDLDVVLEFKNRIKDRLIKVIESV